MSNSGAAKVVGGVRAPPALDPERMALTQPWRDFVSRGLVTNMTLVFTPGGTSVVIAVSDAVKLPKGVDRSSVPPGIAKQAIRDSGLGNQAKAKDSKNQEQPLPVRSLSVRDLEPGRQGTISQRIAAVAKAIGPTSAAGRIGSCQLTLEGANNFKKWWTATSLENKVRLLTSDKHFKELSKVQVLDLASHLPDESPFRGSVPTPKEEESEVEEIRRGSKDRALTKKGGRS